jgi:hypothetical protein
MNVLRVRGAEAMQEALREADKGNYQQGQEKIQKAMSDVQNCKNVSDKRLQMLQQDLKVCVESCNQEKFELSGKKAMIQNTRAHMEKRSRGIEVDAYANCMQEQFVTKQKAMKK